MKAPPYQTPCHSACDLGKILVAEHDSINETEAQVGTSWDEPGTHVSLKDYILVIYCFLTNYAPPPKLVAENSIHYYLLISLGEESGCSSAGYPWLKVSLRL